MFNPPVYVRTGGGYNYTNRFGHCSFDAIMLQCVEKIDVQKVK
jgi:hypothetical protein